MGKVNAMKIFPYLNGMARARGQASAQFLATEFRADRGAIPSVSPL